MAERLEKTSPQDHHGFPLSTTPFSAVYHSMSRYLPPHAPLSTTPRSAVYHPMPRCLPPHAPLSTTPCPAGYHPIHPCGARSGVLVARSRHAAVKTRRRRARTLGRVRGAGTGMEPSLGHGSGGSLQWLPARVMSDLPRWHTQRYGRCQNSRYLFGQRRSTS